MLFRGKGVDRRWVEWRTHKDKNEPFCQIRYETLSHHVLRAELDVARISGFFFSLNPWLEYSHPCSVRLPTLWQCPESPPMLGGR